MHEVILPTFAQAEQIESAEHIESPCVGGKQARRTQCEGSPQIATQDVSSRFVIGLYRMQHDSCYGRSMSESRQKHEHVRISSMQSFFAQRDRMTVQNFQT